jgi:hypothetical protein
MPNTFTLIASSTVGSGGVSSIDFTSIPQTYTDLLLKISTRHDGATVANGQWAYLNGDTTNANYTARYLEGVGSGTPGSASTTTGYIGVEPGASATASTFSNTEVYIPNYTLSNKKSYSVDSVTENNATAAVQWLLAMLWDNTAAITSISIRPDVNTRKEVQYSTAYLYGIKKD